ncbi:hypothetical protein [Phenylobacterium sp.]|jgi:hypothetical protein|nr:hypothetical protein [Phenylobacterium sp.]
MFVTRREGGPNVRMDGEGYNPGDWPAFSAERRLIDANHVQLGG